MLEAHYKGMGAIGLAKKTKTLEHANAPYVAYAMNNTTRAGNMDLLGAALSSNANGNQVMSIMRFVAYERGKEVNMKETMTAILEKYSEPSVQASTGTGFILTYGYKDGKVVRAERPCKGLTQAASLSLDSETVLNSDEWQGKIAGSAANDIKLTSEEDGCSAAVYIFLGNGYVSERQRNENVLSLMRTVFIDADRVRAALARDAVVQREPQEKAKKAAPTGSGATKL